MDQKENARGQGGRGETYSREMEHAQAHEINHAAAPSRLTPSFDEMARYREAKLELIPLHRWNAVDAKGRDRGKSPIDPTWQHRAYPP